MPKLKGGPELQPKRALPFKQSIGNVHGVLKVRQQNPFFDDSPANVIDPDGQTIFETKFAQIISAFQIELAAGAFFRA